MGDVINSSAKVLKFFGADENISKVNWKVGASMEEMMKMRSIGIVNIAERDDKKRKKEKKQFTKTARFVNKISKIKLLKWPSKISSKEQSETKNLMQQFD